MHFKSETQTQLAATQVISHAVYPGELRTSRCLKDTLEKYLSNRTNELFDLEDKIILIDKLSECSNTKSSVVVLDAGIATKMIWRSYQKKDIDIYALAAQRSGTMK